MPANRSYKGKKKIPLGKIQKTKPMAQHVPAPTVEKLHSGTRNLRKATNAAHKRKKKK